MYVSIVLAGKQQISPMSTMHLRRVSTVASSYNPYPHMQFPSTSSSILPQVQEGKFMNSNARPLKNKEGIKQDAGDFWRTDYLCCCAVNIRQHHVLCKCCKPCNTAHNF